MYPGCFGYCVRRVIILSKRLPLGWARRLWLWCLVVSILAWHAQWACFHWAWALRGLGWGTHGSEVLSGGERRRPALGWACPLPSFGPRAASPAVCLDDVWWPCRVQAPLPSPECVGDKGACVWSLEAAGLSALSPALRGL